MWSNLLRGWLMRTATDQLRGAAQDALHSAASAPQSPAATPSPDASPPRCHVGIVCALALEARAIADLLAGVVSHEGDGFIAHEGGISGRRVVVVESGPGMARAAAATRALIAGHQPSWVIAAGLAGGLDPRLAAGDLLMADSLTDSAGRRLDLDLKLTASLPPRVHAGRLLTLDRVVTQPSDKQALGQAHGAMAVDMESVAVADVCRQEHVRLLCVRAISDPVDRQLPPDVEYLLARSTPAARWGAAAGTVLRRPSRIKQLWQLREDALRAADRLAHFLASMIGQLPAEEPAGH